MNRTPTKPCVFNRGTVVLLSIILGMLVGAVFAGVLANWTAGVLYKDLTDVCKARGGVVETFGQDKVCVRSSRSRSPM